MIREMDQFVNQVQQAIILSCYHNCPAKTTHSAGTAPWWNKKLSGLSAKKKAIQYSEKIRAMGYL
jgi:hypothetical protein